MERISEGAASQYGKLNRPREKKIASPRAADTEGWVPPLHAMTTHASRVFLTSSSFLLSTSYLGPSVHDTRPT